MLSYAKITIFPTLQYTVKHPFPGFLLSFLLGGDKMKIAGNFVTSPRRTSMIITQCDKFHLFTWHLHIWAILFS